MLFRIAYLCRVKIEIAYKLISTYNEYMDAFVLLTVNDA